MGAQVTELPIRRARGHGGAPVTRPLKQHLIERQSIAPTT